MSKPNTLGGNCSVKLTAFYVPITILLENTNGITTKSSRKNKPLKERSLLRAMVWSMKQRSVRLNVNYWRISNLTRISINHKHCASRSDMAEQAAKFLVCGVFFHQSTKRHLMLWINRIPLMNSLEFFKNFSLQPYQFSEWNGYSKCYFAKASQQFLASCVV